MEIDFCLWPLFVGFYGITTGRSIGSGTIIHEDGTILTCAHVVAYSQKLRSSSKGKVCYLIGILKHRYRDYIYCIYLKVTGNFLNRLIISLPLILDLMNICVFSTCLSFK